MIGVVYLAQCLLVAYQQYMGWAASEFTRLLLPPTRGWSYFIFYVGMRTVVPYLISLTGALIFLFAAQWANRRYAERFFEREEIYLAAYSMFLVGYPGILVYVPLVLVVYLFLQIVSALLSEGMSRIPMYHLWVPLAIFVILALKWLTQVPVWGRLIV